MNIPHVVAAVALALTTAPVSAQNTDRDVDVRIELDQAEAVIAILETRARGTVPAETDWQRLEATSGYVRLKRRQESFGAERFDERFRDFLSSAEVLERLPALRDALLKWRSIDVSAAAARAHAYLPAQLAIRATIYPVIKRPRNSFVFELDTDPAIFMYVNPDRSAAELENTLAHELHHVGAAACAEPEGEDNLDPPARRAVGWLSAFAEGMAVLAAAGGPHVHPHSTSTPDAWATWERDIANFATDLPALEEFFWQVLREAQPVPALRTRLFSFISTEEVPQGAFYTVGWKMAALVEEVQGRDVVLRGVCDPRILLGAYNEVAAAHSRSDANPLPLWSQDLLSALGLAQ